MQREKDLEKQIIIHDGKFLVSGSQIVLWSQICLKEKQYRYYKETGNTSTSVDCIIKLVLCLKVTMWAMNSVNLIFFLNEKALYIYISWIIFLTICICILHFTEPNNADDVSSHCTGDKIYATWCTSFRLLEFLLPWQPGRSSKFSGWVL